ncbi:formamidopyrimidine-DNA glycosylase domain protein [Mycobacteroides abscessus 1948]|uniref:Formamidopyrimidine-DNA glycosylase domain protein n=1 Tax=Mycobacteroides abscessus 1948 TaxID=1299323 RepID=A0A829QB96_9MYCO|nr:formamidopyrimidine-DNA glycosylase domain protein [Mycobacteroides abscessus 1948]
MPEGHTLHRLARLHQRRFAGAPVSVSSPQGRFTEGAGRGQWTYLCPGARLG